MPKGNWRGHVALGLGAALFVSWAVTAVHYPATPWPSKFRENPSKTASDRSTTYQHAANESAAWIDGILTAPRQDAIAESEADKGDKKPNGDYHDALDLAAQWVTADSSVNMVILTLLQVAIGGGGLIALFYSLAMTRKSVDLAADALAETQKSVRLAEDNAKRELRAYVSVEPRVENIEADQRIRFILDASNTGPTPARNVTARTAVFVRNSPFTLAQERAENATRPILRRKTIIYPGGKTTFPRNSDFILPSDALDAIKADKAVIMFTGEVYYDDVFDKPHVSMFRFEFSGDECFRINKLRMSDEGNDAT